MIRRILALLLAILILSLIRTSQISATSNTLVIAQVMAGAASGVTSAALSEFISIYNNSGSDVEVTNWCLINKSNVKFVCLTPTSSNLHYYVASHSYINFASQTFESLNNYTADFNYLSTNLSSGSIVGSSDSISLVDDKSTLIDNISWTSSLAGGKSLSRNASADPLILNDTDLMSDFTTKSDLLIQNSGLYEKIIAVDFCNNIDGLQLEVPIGYGSDGSGNCGVDYCPNLTGWQVSIPDGMRKDGLGNCITIDLCQNIVGSQQYIPVGYVQDEYADCHVKVDNLVITEILPNAVGKDDGNEFIEIYNSSNNRVDLAYYKLMIGVDSPRAYSLNGYGYIEPNAYYAIYNSSINFSLVNSTSKVSLETVDSQQISSTDLYQNPKEGESWDLINGLWQYSNQPTPGYENLASLISDVEITEKICASNQYLNPATGRCKLIATAALTPCGDGEYRSESTNRCRSITSIVNQDNSCPLGQYRNPETNRCKKIVTMSQADYPSDVVTASVENRNGQIVLMGVMSSSLAYGAWEWRYEFSGLLRKIRKHLANRL